jgi:uncharacterized protein (TIGR02594 family)
LNVTAFSLASRYAGVDELSGDKHHPLIQWWFSLCGMGLETPDEVPWCSAFMQGPTWELRLPRSKSAAARSWLGVGTPVELRDAKPGFDVVVLKRGKGPQPGPEVLSGAPGHVGFFAGLEYDSADEPRSVLLLSGNTGNRVCVAPFLVSDVLGVRRLV